MADDRYMSGRESINAYMDTVNRLLEDEGTHRATYTTCNWYYMRGHSPAFAVHDILLSRKVGA